MYSSLTSHIANYFIAPYNLGMAVCIGGSFGTIVAPLSEGTDNTAGRGHGWPRAN